MERYTFFEQLALFQEFFVMGWDEKRVTTLKKLWLDGLSASLIAKQLGGVTRNAVIGKVHSLGLNGRNQATAQTRPALRRSGKSVQSGTQVPIQKKIEQLPRVVVREPTRTATTFDPDARVGLCRSLLDLESTSCKWPIGEPSSTEFSFCGRPRENDHDPYCQGHNSRARAPTAKHQSTTRSPRSNLLRSLTAYL